MRDELKSRVVVVALHSVRSDTLTHSDTYHQHNTLLLYYWCIIIVRITDNVVDLFIYFLFTLLLVVSCFTFYFGFLLKLYQYSFDYIEVPRLPSKVFSFLRALR